VGFIDFHTHAFPDELAERAISVLESAANWKAVARGTVKELLASMDRADVEASLVCAIATKPGQAKGILKWCGKIATDRLLPLPSVHPMDDDRAGWVDTFAQEGYRGIKLHPMYQDFVADEPRMDEIYAAASLHGLLVVVHCGCDIAYDPDDDRASPARFRRVIDKFPDLKLICTHMGGWRAWDAVSEHLIGTNVYLETSFSLADLGPEKGVDMIRRHGPDRVLMGSDWPWKTQASAIQDVQSLPLTEQEKQKILWSNAARLIC
jgi:uncharacterized protein